MAEGGGLGDVLVADDGGERVEEDVDEIAREMWTSSLGAAEDMTGQGGGCGRRPPVLNGVWTRDEPHPRRAALTVWYTVSIVCLGLTMGAQGPATIKLAEQCGFVIDLGIVNGTEKLDTSDLDELGIATGCDAIAGIMGCMLGAYLVENFEPWHILHVICMAWTGMAFAAWTQASGFASMLLATAYWSTFSVVPGQTTQAALTWMWGTEVAPYMNVLHAGFGVGSLLAPLLVSWDLRQHDSFHYAYW